VFDIKAAEDSRTPRRWCVLLCAFTYSAMSVFGQEKVTYQDHVLPLIENHCAKCHNGDKKKGDLDLTSYNGAMKGGGSGQVVMSGNPDSSKLYKSISHAEEPTMPPNKPRLPDRELEVFKKWIAGGLLETSGSKAIAVAKPTVDLAVKGSGMAKPEGPPPMPPELPLDPVVHTPRGSALTGLAASPWAPLVAIGGQKQVLLYNTDSLELIGIIPFAEGTPAHVQFSRNGKLLLVAGGHGGKSGRVVVWDIVKAERVMTAGAEYDTVLAADISPDQTKIALGGPDRLVKIYSTASGEVLHKIKKHTDWVTAVAFSGNGEFVASGDRNGGISIWDADNGQEMFTLAGHKGAVTALSWRDDSRILASSSEDGAIKWWESQEGKQAKTWNAHSGGTLSVSFTHDGRLVSCGRDNQVTLWNADGNKAKSFDFFGEMPLRAALAHDGARVVAIDFNGRAAAWTSSDGKRLAELDLNPAPLAEQIAAVAKRLQELQARGDKPSPALTEAEAKLAAAKGEVDTAKKALEQAMAEKTAKEGEVERLKVEAAKTPPPADIQAKLASAREVRGKAREAFTNATEALKTKTAAIDVAKTKVAELKAQDPADAIAAAQARLARLKAAQSVGAVFRTRESVATRKREHEQLLADITAKKEEITRLNKEIEAADAAAQSKLKGQIKTLSTEIKTAEATVKKVAKDLAAEEAKLKQLTAEAEKVRTASVGAVQQSKL
jgi:predicted  nucleic acid-binding Zn-ribbon protein